MSSETNIAYLAGVIDGEGSIFINSFKAYCLRISNTDLFLIEKLKEILLSEGIEVHIYEAGNNTQGKNWKKGYQLQMTRKSEIIKVLNKIIPFLISKKMRAEIMRDAIEGKITHIDAFTKLKLLNRKGV